MRKWSEKKMERGSGMRKQIQKVLSEIEKRKIVRKWKEKTERAVNKSGVRKQRESGEKTKIEKVELKLERENREC